jgi:hypothetical protein
MKLNVMFLLLAMALLSATCDNKTEKKEPVSEPEKKEEVKEETKASVPFEILFTDRSCNIGKASQTAVFNQKEFDAEWKRLFDKMDVSPEKPRVDFDKKLVLFICLGEIGKGGHSLAIQNIEDAGETFNVTASHVIPGKNCMSTMSIEYPYWIVSVDKKKATKVNFKITDDIKDCVQ